MSGVDLQTIWTRSFNFQHATRRKLSLLVFVATSRPRDYAADPRAERIAAAAKRLGELRRGWLNPPDLVDIVPEITPTAAPGEAPRRYPDRILPKTAEPAVKLKARTLTNLYNERPRWLGLAHDALDWAVAAAYDWPEAISTEDALPRLLALNLERATASRAGAPL